MRGSRRGVMRGVHDDVCIVESRAVEFRERFLIHFGDIPIVQVVPEGSKRDLSASLVTSRALASYQGLRMPA